MLGGHHHLQDYTFVVVVVAVVVVVVDAVVAVVDLVLHRLRASL